MANPQKEDGYTDIANEIMDYLCQFRIPGEVRQIVDCVFRKTYGFHKIDDFISNSQLCEMTRMTKGNVSRSLSKAITHKLVIKTDNKLRINKNYDEWIPFKKVIKTDNRNQEKVIKSETKVIKSETDLTPEKLSKVRDTKPITKPNITKPIISKDISGKPQDKRNPDLQSLIDFSDSIGFAIQGTLKDNRFFAYNLLRKFGLEKSKRAVEYAVNARGKPYAPTINDFPSLYRKIGDLINFFEKEKHERNKNVIG